MTCLTHATAVMLFLEPMLAGETVVTQCAQVSGSRVMQVLSPKHAADNGDSTISHTITLPVGVSPQTSAAPAYKLRRETIRLSSELESVKGTSVIQLHSTLFNHCWLVASTQP